MTLYSRVVTDSSLRRFIFIPDELSINTACVPLRAVFKVHGVSAVQVRALRDGIGVA